MGSGCTNNAYSSRCPEGESLSSNCVIWAGEPVEFLGICSGDTITEVAEFIILKLLSILEGTGITLNGLTASCSDISQKIQNSDKTLSAILNIIIEKECSLQTAIDTLVVTIQNNDVLSALDLKCLTGTITTRSQLEQSLINKVCSLQDQIDALQSSIPPSTDIESVVTDILFNKLSSCNNGIKVTGTGKNRTYNFYGIVPVGGRLFGDFPLTKFDNTGLGQDDMCGFALCNGLNGTRDMRDYVPSMASSTVGVNRTFTNQTTVGAIKGTNDVTLISANLPDHNHAVSQSPHSHTYTPSLLSTTTAAGYGFRYEYLTPPLGSGQQRYIQNSSAPENTSSNGISLTVGGMQGATGQAINNIQPTVYGVWIQRIS